MDGPLESPSESGTKEAPRYPRWWEPYFAALAENGVKLYACNAVPIDESTPRKWLEDNPWGKEEFDRREAVALELSGQHLLMEARRRARFGVERPILYKGKQVKDEATGEPLVLREYSDTLLIFLLKGQYPEKFRERYDVAARVGVYGIDELLAATEEGG